MSNERVFCNWWKCIRQFFRRVPRQTLVQPTFSSSFIQYWYCQNWDHDRWIKEYEMLQKIGINEIILQNIADTKAHYSVYPTKMAGYTSNTIDMLKTALSAAEVVGMNVRIGLGYHEDWWLINALDQVWLDHEARENTRIIEEVVSTYGGHKAFNGWYIPYEFHPLMTLSQFQQVNLNQFFQKIARSIIVNSAKKNIMIAPYFNVPLLSPVTLAAWANSVQHVLKDTGVDILALQDSVGAGFNKLEYLDEIFAYTKKATEEIGIILYATTETFAATVKGNLPAQQSRIRQQLLIESAYVNGFVAFSINHYQNGNQPTQVAGYQDYYLYYLDYLM